MEPINLRTWQRVHEGIDAHLPRTGEWPRPYEAAVASGKIILPKNVELDSGIPKPDPEEHQAA